MKRSHFALPYAVWMLILILAPMLLIAFYAVTNTGPGGVGGALNGEIIFSLEHLARVFEPMFLQVLWRSVELAVISTLFCLALGYPTAYILSRMPMRRAGFLLMFFVVPMWMNFLLRTYAWMVLLDNNGLINTLLTTLGLAKMQMLYTSSAVVLGMVYNFIPFMILPIYTVLIKINRSHIEAAQDLGANAMQVFFRVTFPLSLPGVVSGITMVFVPAITTFAISRLLGGSQFMLYGDLIENQFILVRDWNFGSSLSLVLLVLVLLSLAVARHFEGAGQEGGQLW